MSVEDDLRKLEARVAALESIFNASGDTAATARPQKALSIREFINNIKPATQNDRILAVGYFYEQVLGNSFFTSDNLKSGYAQAKMVGPKNFSDALAQNAKKGLVMEAEKQSGRTRNWVLTGTGEDYVKAMIEKNA